MAKYSSQVQIASDSAIFRPLDGNRKMNALHLTRLRASMEAHGFLMMPILVNERMEIIDGQHRVTVANELRLPIPYIVMKGYGIREVQILNENAKNWNANDYLACYVDEGKEDYQTYAAFMAKYKLDHNVCMGLLSGSTTGKTVQEKFKAGEFKVKSYAKACEVADKILSIAPFYAGFKRWVFVVALLRLLENERFNFPEFIEKLRLQPASLVDCTNVDAYRLLIERIYNYKRRDKVNLRF